MLRRLPAFALLAAPLLGVFCALGLNYSDCLPPVAEHHLQFLLFNGALAVLLNWRLASAARPGREHCCFWRSLPPAISAFNNTCESLATIRPII